MEDTEPCVREPVEKLIKRYEDDAVKVPKFNKELELFGEYDHIEMDAEGKIPTYFDSENYWGPSRSKEWKKNPNAKLLSYEEAFKKMTTENNTQFFNESKVQHIALLPKYIQEIKKGVKEKLNVGIFMFSKELGGVPIAYKNVQILQSLGRIRSEQPCLHFDVRADFILFKPTPGCRVIGQVRLVTQKNMVCHIHQFFTAWFPITQLPNKYRNSAFNGALVELEVIAIHTNNNVLSMKTKFIKVISETIAPKTVTEHQASDEPVDVTDAIGSPMLSSTQVTSKKSKKAKKVKMKELNGNADLELSVIEDVDMPRGSVGSCDVDGDVLEKSSSENKKRKNKKKKKFDVEETDGDSKQAGIEEKGEAGGSLNGMLDTAEVNDLVDIKYSGVKRKKKKHKKSELEVNGEDVGEYGSIVGNETERTEQSKRKKREHDSLEVSSSSIGDPSTEHKKLKKRKKHKSDIDIKT